MHNATKTIFGITFINALIGFSIPTFAVDHATHAANTTVNLQVSQTNAALRDLWVGHAFWVRAVVIETLEGNTAAATAAENAAVENAKQIAAAMEPFYGKPAADSLFNLLAGHYTAVKQYLLATKMKSETKQKEAMQAMFANAEQLAVFLSTANPNLPIETLRGMLLGHGGHHVQQIQQISEHKYAEETQTWEMMKLHMYAIADAFSGALVKQFPAKFK